MAKKIRFPLVMKDGVEVRDIGELKENFSLEQILVYLEDGKLVKWLCDRSEEELAERVQALNQEDADFYKKICDIFEAEYTGTQEDMERAMERKRKETLLKEFTDEGKYLEVVEQIAFSQDDLYDLLHEGITEIYLCGERFSIPLGKSGVQYIGINSPVAVISSKHKIDFEEKQISFQGVKFDEKYKEILKANLVTGSGSGAEEEEEQNEAPARRPFGRVNFLTKDLENAQDWIATIAIHGETEDILKDRYQDMAKCSAKIRKTISEDSYLKKRFQTLASVFGDWLAEQLYGGHPEIMALVDKHNEDEVMLEKVFFLYAKRIGGSGDIDLMCEMHKVWYKDEEADSKKTEAELRKTQAELIVEESDFVRGKRPIKTAVTKKPAAAKTKKPNTKSPKEEKSEEQLSDEEIELMLDQDQELQAVLAAIAAEPSMEEIMDRSMKNALAATGLHDTEEEQPDKEQQELNEDFQKWIRDHAGEFASKWWDEHLKKAHERGEMSTADLQKQDEIAEESK